MLEPALDTLPRTSDLADEALVRRVVAGERDAFAVLMRRYNQRVFRVARGILRSDAEAEDVSQDAFVRAYEKLDQLATPAAFAGWISRIAANMALLRLRRHRTLRAILERGETTPMIDDLPATPPDQAAYRRELRAMIEEAIDRLPSRYRSVLVLRDIEGMSTDETAGALELAPGTVRVRLHRARALMRDRLGREIDLAAADAFAFDGERCDRMVARVFRRIEALCNEGGDPGLPLS